MDRKLPHRGADQRWATFVRNEAKAIVACDFFISVTLSFRVWYVFVVMEIGSRRILHCNVTAHPTAEWTTQQFREVLADLHPYRFIIHDRDSIFSPWLDLTLNDFGVRVIRTPVQAPTTNAFCERLIGTIRRECLDYISSPQRAAPAADSSRIRCFLQSRTSSFGLRPWHTGTNPAECSDQRPSAPASRRSPNHIQARARRIASRLSAGRGGRLARTEFLRTTGKSQLNDGLSEFERAVFRLQDF